MLALRPYLGKLTHSELFALTTACLASIGGAFLAILSVLGVSIFRDGGGGGGEGGCGGGRGWWSCWRFAGMLGW